VRLRHRLIFPGAGDQSALTVPGPVRAPRGVWSGDREGEATVKGTTVIDTTAGVGTVAGDGVASIGESGEVGIGGAGR